MDNLLPNRHETGLINDDAIFEKTSIFRDKDWNVVYGEEDLHKMFEKMARKKTDNSENDCGNYLYEKDLTKKLPRKVTQLMKPTERKSR